VIRTGYEAETRDPARTGLKPAGDGKMWWDDRFRPPLCQAGLGSFSAVMASLAGECLRALEDRENWHLELGGPDEQPYGVYLKKHHVRTWRSRLRAKLGVGPGETAGRIEAQNVGSLTADGIGVMNLVAYGEKLHRNGLVESFVLTEELEGYTELSQFILRRFPAGICDLGFGIWDLGFGEAQSSTLFSQPSTLNSQPSTLNRQPSTLNPQPSVGQPTTDSPQIPKSQIPNPKSQIPKSLNPSTPRRDHDLYRLICRLADTVRRFHAAGYNHRDLYCCHFFVKEPVRGEFEVRLIDLQRVQHRRRFRRRWLVKDLAQLAWSVPRDRIKCTHKMAFIRHYLGVRRLRPADKRLIREVLSKQQVMERRLGVQS